MNNLNGKFSKEKDRDQQMEEDEWNCNRLRKSWIKKIICGNLVIESVNDWSLFS